MIPKFRGLSVELNGEQNWKYGYLIEDGGESFIINQVIEANEQYITIGSWDPVRPETVSQSTDLKDKNGKEIFEGDILKFNDEWDDYCYEGYVDGSIEGINFVEIKRKKTYFTFGKFKTSGSSLLNLMGYENIPFEDLITYKDFEFEIIGNIWENKELLEESNNG